MVNRVEFRMIILLFILGTVLGYRLALWKRSITNVKFTHPLANDICRGYIQKNEWDKKSLAYWMALDGCEYGVEVARREGR